MKSNHLAEIFESNYNSLSHLQQTMFELYRSTDGNSNKIATAYLKDNPPLKQKFDFLKILAQDVKHSLNPSNTDE